MFVKTLFDSTQSHTRRKKNGVGFFQWGDELRIKTDLQIWKKRKAISHWRTDDVWERVRYGVEHLQLGAASKRLCIWSYVNFTNASYCSANFVVKTASYCSRNESSRSFSMLSHIICTCNKTQNLATNTHHHLNWMPLPVWTWKDPFPDSVNVVEYLDAVDYPGPFLNRLIPSLAFSQHCDTWNSTAFVDANVWFLRECSAPFFLNEVDNCNC